MTTLHIGLIGDYNPDVIAHQAIPKALALAGCGWRARRTTVAGHRQPQRP